jgi:hypothetical protein
MPEDKHDTAKRLVKDILPPRRRNLIIPLIRTICSATPYRRKIDDLGDLARRWRSISVPLDSTLFKEHIPSIELLTVSLKKDFVTLPVSLQSAVMSSLNKVESITIISPGRDLQSLQLQGPQLDLGTPNIKLVSEEDVMTQESRERIGKIFRDRAGWVIQQLLTVKFCLESKARGVLVINADTVLLREHQWLDNSGKQILMPSLECHLPYYQFLNRAFNLSSKPKFTFVTHHMLIQPEVLREIFSRLSIQSIDQLIDLIERFADRDDSSAVCLEFEIYAQCLMKFYANRTSLVKFLNAGSPDRDTLIPKLDLLRRDLGVTGRLNSISFHEYLN